MRASVDILSPSEAARRLGISAKALRIYEERGLLRPARTATGWRAYGPDEIRRAAEIVTLRSLGFSLGQIEHVLGGSADGLEPALGSLQVRLESEFEQLRRRLEKINTLRDALARGETPSLPDLTSLAAAPTAARLANLPEVGRVTTLSSLIPADQPQKLASISAAAQSLLPALTQQPAPPTTDAQRVAALKRAANQLSYAAEDHPGPGAAEARRLSAALGRLAAADSATRDHADTTT